MGQFKNKRSKSARNRQPAVAPRTVPALPRPGDAEPAVRSQIATARLEHKEKELAKTQAELKALQNIRADELNRDRQMIKRLRSDHSAVEDRSNALREELRLAKRRNQRLRRKLAKVAEAVESMEDRYELACKAVGGEFEEHLQAEVESNEYDEESEDSSSDEEEVEDGDEWEGEAGGVQESDVLGVFTVGRSDA